MHVRRRTCVWARDAFIVFLNRFARSHKMYPSLCRRMLVMLDFRVRRARTYWRIKGKSYASSNVISYQQWTERAILTPMKVRAVYLNSAPLTSVQLSQFSQRVTHSADTLLFIYGCMCRVAIYTCLRLEFPLAIPRAFTVSAMVSMRHSGTILG